MMAERPGEGASPIGEAGSAQSVELGSMHRMLTVQSARTETARCGRQGPPSALASARRRTQRTPPCLSSRGKGGAVLVSHLVFLAYMATTTRLPVVTSSHYPNRLAEMRKSRISFIASCTSRPIGRKLRSRAARSTLAGPAAAVLIVRCNGVPSIRHGSVGPRRR